MVQLDAEEHELTSRWLHNVVWLNVGLDSNLLNGLDDHLSIGEELLVGGSNHSELLQGLSLAVVALDQASKHR